MLRRASILTVAAGGTAAAIALSTRRRWQSALDPCGPDGLRLPEGEAVKVTTDDGAILHAHVAGAGDGRPVVMAHGWTESCEVWAAVARRLVERGHRVVLYDQRGHGSSTFGEEGFGVSRLGKDVRAVLEQFDLRDAVLVGHSMGGTSVQAFAVEHPDAAAGRVSGLVLVATAAHGMGGLPSDRLIRWIAASPSVDRAFRRAGPLMTRCSVGKVVCYPHLRYAANSWLNTPAEVRLGCVAELQTVDLRSGLADVQLPAAVIVGSRDTLTPPRLGRALAAALPHATLVEVPGMGHMLPLEIPDQVADLIQATLERAADSH
jgi:pimeloyl-ACP methyl ester carboxylesterase